MPSIHSKQQTQSEEEEKKADNGSIFSVKIWYAPRRMWTIVIVRWLTVVEIRRCYDKIEIGSTAAYSMRIDTQMGDGLPRVVTTKLNGKKNGSRNAKK